MQELNSIELVEINGGSTSGCPCGCQIVVGIGKFVLGVFAGISDGLSDGMAD